MIKVPTVLILGAGASMPFGYPSGQGLIKQIGRSLCPPEFRDGPNLDPEFTRLMEECGFERNRLQEFGRHLLLSQQASIDSFLEHNSDFAEMGKCAIVTKLLLTDKQTELKTPDWYGILWNALSNDCTCDNFEKNQLSIITFNYDSSLERFLGNAIISTFRNACSDESAKERLLRAIPIVHIYGRLPASISRHLNPDGIKKLAQRIKIIHDEEADSVHELERAKALIAKAKKVCIMGFGFHETNLKRLNLHKDCERMLLHDRVTYASYFGATPADLWRLRMHSFGVDLNYCYIGHPTWQNVEFLRNFGPFMPAAFIPEQNFNINYGYGDVVPPHIFENEESEEA
jgi:hypothetical protein